MHPCTMRRVRDTAPRGVSSCHQPQRELYLLLTSHTGIVATPKREGTIHMIRTPSLTLLLSGSALWLTGCALASDDGGTRNQDRATALGILQDRAGSTVTLETNEIGTTRIVAMTPRFPVPTHASDPVEAATEFLAEHHAVFQLDAADAASFVATRFDPEPRLDLTHVTLQRVFNGIPVFQGALTVHMDGANGVVRVLGDEFYLVSEPTNRMVLSPIEAANAAGHAYGLNVTPAQIDSEGPATTFVAAGLLDPIKVEPRIVQLAPADNRFAYQVQISWLDTSKQQQYQLALVDATDGSVLRDYSLVNTFTGRVFNVNAQPTATQSTDTRTVVSFDGNPAASPNGWVGAARNTVGNNAVAATDLDGNNTVGANETQPVANASDSFDFPYSATTDASNFKPASVSNAFFLVNDWHDRTYVLGFNEASGNFQTNNFGKGGAQNDPVNVDSQDGSGTNNANFSTPTDGSRPRMQMFLFNIKNGAGGVRQDGDFDPSVIYHENTHGLSNRLVGGGSGGCLGGLQAGGMGEGWGDFMGSSFLNNPIVGAYVTGNATVGIRRQSMANSTFTYNDIKNGTLAEVHDAGELWAATLWDVRKSLGAAVTEQLVVTGMKMTPCNPSMLNARDGIISADASVNGGANKCKLWTAFAGRLMGTGASSPTSNSTTQIVTSTTVPTDCQAGTTTLFSDDFETDKGWRANPNGTDTAVTGQWQRANPEATTSGGVSTQNGTTPSGSFDLVTAGAAGASAGVNDVDGGTTTIQSPAIVIPNGGAVTLSFKSYFAHLNNAGTDDFFRVQVVGTTTTTALNTAGAATNVAATFASNSVDISAFRGQTIRIMISAADNGTGSLIEAAVDDVVITQAAQ
ncbi:MAG: hypothetical protein E6J90_41810 [Deltaproteobacteria bacterium]|nr:MAG: hypothetical protein E6J90_41810 [Deltaproteobacteria bacterium]